MASRALIAPSLLTPEEAARALGVGERTLRDLRKRGLIRYVAVTERKIMYRPEDCEEYIQSRVRQDEPCQPPQRRHKSTRRRTGNIVPFTKLMGG